jgi:Resolvase, N terminal domain
VSNNSGTAVSRTAGGVTLTPASLAGADEDDLLAPEPAKLTGALIGYARVSTSGQNPDRQTRALTEAGCIRIFADKQSGKTADRPELAACLDYLRAGDTLVMPSLDRLSRSLQDLGWFPGQLSGRGLASRALPRIDPNGERPHLDVPLTPRAWPGRDTDQSCGHDDPATADGPRRHADSAGR